MDHDMVVREKIAEKYLLNELDSDARNEFEEHFFDCPECALDVQAGVRFVEESKIVLAEKVEPTRSVTLPVDVPGTPGWFAWLRPSLAAPVLALLLVVVGYQNLVIYPRLKQALNRPQILPWAMVNVGVWGANAPVIAGPPGTGFLLFVRIPGDSNYVAYKAELYNPAGKLEWSLTIPANSAEDTWPIQVPAGNRESGTYTLAVLGTTAKGESQEIGRSSFELQIKK